MNDDAAAPQHGHRIGTIRIVHLVVVNEAAPIAPDSDAELVHSATSIDLTINRREHKAVAATAIDCANPFVLRFRPRHDQPIVARAGEVEIARFELELGVASRGGRVRLILRDKTEVRLASQRRIRHISPGWRVDPAAVSHEPAVRIVNHDHRRQPVNGVGRACSTTTPHPA